MHGYHLQSEEINTLKDKLTPDVMVELGTTLIHHGRFPDNNFLENFVLDKTPDNLKFRNENTNTLTHQTVVILCNLGTETFHKQNSKWNPLAFKGMKQVFYLNHKDVYSPRPFQIDSSGKDRIIYEYEYLILPQVQHQDQDQDQN